MTTAVKNLVDAAMGVYLQHGYSGQTWTSDPEAPGYTVECRCGAEFYIGEIKTVDPPDRPERMDQLESIAAASPDGWLGSEAERAEYSKLVRERDAVRKQVIDTNADIQFRALHEPVMKHIRDMFTKALA